MDTMNPAPEESLPTDLRGPLVRPYAMTHGRTSTSAEPFTLITLVVPAGPAPDSNTLEPEHRAILNVLQQPMSVAEISARLDLPLGVVRVLLSDLMESTAITVRGPLTVSRLPHRGTLKAVISGLRAL